MFGCSEGSLYVRRVPACDRNGSKLFRRGYVSHTGPGYDVHGLTIKLWLLYCYRRIKTTIYLLFLMTSCWLIVVSRVCKSQSPLHAGRAGNGLLNIATFPCHSHAKKHFGSKKVLMNSKVSYETTLVICQSVSVTTRHENHFVNSPGRAAQWTSDVAVREVAALPGQRVDLRGSAISEKS